MTAPTDRWTIDPQDVAGGSIVAGEIHVRSWRDDMPESGAEVEFAGQVWLVTQTHVPWPGGRSTFTAILLPGSVAGE